MQINNDILKKLSSMNDNDFKRLISGVAAESGISPSSISDTDLSKIRSILSTVDPNDPAVTEAVNKIRKDITKRSKDH